MAYQKTYNMHVLYPKWEEFVCGLGECSILSTSALTVLGFLPLPRLRQKADEDEETAKEDVEAERRARKMTHHHF